MTGPVNFLALTFPTHTVDAIAATLRPGAAAVLLVYENVWAGRVAEAVRILA